MRKTILTLIAAIAITACSDDKVSFQTQEQSRQASIENAEYNARVYRDAYAPQLKIKVRGDSSISASCAMGDGWSSVDLVGDSGITRQELKCSTVSGAIGCMNKADFQARKDYAKQEGSCNQELPFPLPKIVK